MPETNVTRVSTTYQQKGGGLKTIPRTKPSINVGYCYLSGFY